MKISNNENSAKAQSSKSRRSSRVCPKPLSDLTNIQTTLPKPKIGKETDKENLNTCRSDKFVFFSNLKFIPESEEVASTSGQDNDINNNLVDTEDPLWLVKAIEKDKGENDLDASSQSCPVIEILSRKNTRSTSIKQRMHGTFPLPDTKTKKRKRQMVSPVKLREPLRPETRSLKAPTEQQESSSSELNTDPKTPMSLPPEFVEQQKAYFSQIDAFELEEESQSSDDG